MWKCPKCGQKNRIDVCSKCGYERKKAPKGSISSLNFILMAIISVIIIVGIFFCVDAYIDYNIEQRAKQYEQLEIESNTAETEFIVGEGQVDPEEVAEE